MHHKTQSELTDRRGDDGLFLKAVQLDYQRLI